MKDGGAHSGLEPRLETAARYSTASTGGDLILNLDELVRIVRRQLWLIGLCVAVAVVLSAVFVSRITPTYSATAQVTLTSENGGLNALGTFFEEINLTNQLIAGEIAVMESGQMLARVSRKLSLLDNPSFNTSLDDEPPAVSVIGYLKGLVKEALSLLQGSELAAVVPAGDLASPDPLSLAAQAEQVAQGDQAEMVSALSRGLGVRQVGSSFLIDVTYTAEDPVIAAGVANTVVDVYIASQLDAKLEASRRVAAGLDNRLRALKARLEASEREVLEFRYQMVRKGSDALVRYEQQIADLTSRLGGVRVAHLQASAELARVDELVASGVAAAAAGVLGSELINAQRGQLAELRQDHERLIDRFGADSPRAMAVANQITLLESEMARELARLREDLNNQAEIALAQVSSLEDSLRQLEIRALETAQELVTLDQLEREVEANRIVYENFLKTFTQTSEVVGLQEADAQVVSYATPPLNPTAPRSMLSIALGAVAGGLIGLGLAFLREWMDTSVATAEQLRARTGLPVYASLSKATTWGFRRADPIKSAVRNPRSALAEEARRLRDLLVLDPSQIARTVAVVSSLPEEGKTTTCLLLANAMSQAGRSCVVVDMNLRRPSVAAALGGEDGSAPDLVSVVEGQATLDDAVRKDALTDIHFLSVRRGVGDPARILASGSMAAIIEELHARFDLVVLDTPAIFVLSDGLAAVRFADAVVFATRWRKTPVETMRRCLRCLAEIGAPVAGAVLTMSEAHRAAGYEFRGYGRSYRAAAGSYAA